MRASFMLAAPGIPDSDPGEMKLLDIAPTLAARMGFILPQAQGRDVLANS